MTRHNADRVYSCQRAVVKSVCYLWLLGLLGAKHNNIIDCLRTFRSMKTNFFSIGISVGRNPFSASLFPLKKSFANLVWRRTRVPTVIFRACERGLDPLQQRSCGTSPAAATRKNYSSFLQHHRRELAGLADRWLCRTVYFITHCYYRLQ